MAQEPITLVDYDPEWVAEYENEEQQIRTAAGEHIEAIEHVGSTSVPGLAAKPIIDIMGGVETLADAEFEAYFPHCRYFRKMDAEIHTHHLHMVEITSDWWDRHLLFRDYLREHPDVAQEYETLKRELAEQHRDDVHEYTDAKTDFIQDVEERARRYDGRK